MQAPARWATRRPWAALAVWVAVLIAVTGTAFGIGSAYHDDNSLPGSQSQKVADKLVGTQDALDEIQVVFHDDAGGVASDPQVAATLRDVRAMPDVKAVQAPSAQTGSVSEDGRTAYATVTLTTIAAETDTAKVADIVDAAEKHSSSGLEVSLAGDSVREASQEGGSAEGIGMGAALVILVILFGSLLAAALPMLTAVFAVGSAVGAVMLVSHLAEMPSYAPAMMTIVGLGVGIDYALLILTRFRGELRVGGTREHATAVAVRTAGRSVLFAGTTVIIALLGLVVLGLGSLQGVAVAVAVTVLLTVIASMTLLPALLTLFGPRLEKQVRKRMAKRPSTIHGKRWRQLSDGVERRPWLALVVAVPLMVVLATPAFGMRLGFADAGTAAEGTTGRTAYDRLAEGFGPGVNGPLFVLAEGTPQEAAAAGGRLRSVEGVADVLGPMPASTGGASSLMVIPTTGPASDETVDLVHRLRDTALPAISADAGGSYAVGGVTAAGIDYADAVGERLLWFMLLVVGLSSVLLMAVFRSVLIPLKAAVLNALSVGASFGVMTWVYGDGHLGVPSGPIEAFLPVVAFAVVFGLSMDYEVFLLSRMHEEWRRTGNAHTAIREGMASTGAVITAAAAIMVVVFGAFMLSPDRMLGQMGLCMASAVLLDAVVIRCLVVPAVMHLLGDKAWWMPRWLDRLLPTVRLEAQETEREEHLRPVEPVPTA
ncbi:MMPL family transporter [Luteipulveratus halotolerans]|uniref:Membrane protein n=1 Tax=Luteipulveratus halotolerans TaxID=1631356 RepID=A0A0L6CLG4_9MICO|nr:MMPL family transporter [Luteipulveratus halotolerans]KNX38607.1 membrane protein [Luteipulveratus halotolerans]